MVPQPNKSVISLMIVVVALTGCTDDPVEATTTATDQPSPTTTFARAEPTNVTEMTVAGVDWLVAIEETSAASSGTFSFDLLEFVPRTNRTETRASVATVFDTQTEAIRSVASGGTSGSREVLVLADTTWLSTHYWPLIEAHGSAVRWIEASTDELVAAGTISTPDPSTLTNPLYFLMGAVNETLTSESQDRRVYTLDIDPELLRLRMPAEAEDRFLIALGGLLDTDRFSQLTGTVSIDPEGRILHLEVVATVHPDLVREFDPSQIVVQVRLGNLDGAVRIEPPDPQTVVHIDDLGELREAALRSETGF